MRPLGRKDTTNDPNIDDQAANLKQNSYCTNETVREVINDEDSKNRDPDLRDSDSPVDDDKAHLLQWGYFASQCFIIRFGRSCVSKIRGKWHSENIRRQRNSKLAVHTIRLGCKRIASASCTSEKERK